MFKNFSRPAGLLLVLASFPLLAQVAAPQFEVASVKPSGPLDPRMIMSGQAHVGISVDSARVDIGSLPLGDLIRIAYHLKPYQVAGPDWIKSERFDIVAKIPEGVSKDKFPEMLQALLADRFKMATHRETKDHPAYALLVGKNGPKLKDAEPLPAVASTDPAAPQGKALVMGSGEYQVRVEPLPAGRGAMVSSPQFGEMKISMTENGMMRMEFARITMQAMADTLSRYTDRPVQDLTELKGTYQATLDISLEDMRAVAMAAGMGQAMGPGGGMMMGRRATEGGPAETASTPGGSIFTAIQTLGLKLEPRKVQVEILVIDHLEKTPTDN
jgi:uncharacterized protein (TIGR03435 family)